MVNCKNMRDVVGVGWCFCCEVKNGFVSTTAANSHLYTQKPSDLSRFQAKEPPQTCGQSPSPRFETKVDEGQWRQDTVLSSEQVVSARQT